ncbi:MAG TPA: hypothetical protein VH158_00450, partial [Gemmatimonadales bacterium]|nr:hypothetical protein [Gemmatimonadales bacterium]
FDVSPGLKGHPLVVELVPAFARVNGATPWRARVRVRFLLREPRSQGDGATVTVVAGGRTAVPLSKRPELALPPGFAPLVEVRIHQAGGGSVDAIRRVAAAP